jgi:hypothetical protein
MSSFAFICFSNKPVGDVITPKAQSSLIYLLRINQTVLIITSTEWMDPMHTLTRSRLFTFLFLLVALTVVRAGFEPIDLALKSYNEDVVVEKNAPAPVVSVTTGSMEQGTANLGFTWFERGYVKEWPATGLPEAGSLLTSDLLADHQYQLAYSYKSNNVILIDAVRTSALLTFAVATNYAQLSFLTSSGVARNQVAYIVHFEDGTSETGEFTSRNWYNDGEPAWAANGCVNVTSFVKANLNSYNPRLYSADISLLNSISPISSVELSLADGSGHAAVFAVSGAALPGSAFVPIEITGYNEDLVVEATAVKPGFMETNTTATMETGATNSRFTWYEQGYCPVAPSSGLPPAGTVIASETNPDYRFRMPRSYADANVILIDSTHTNAVLTLAAPRKYSALSFLTASAGGPTINECVVRHGDGRFQTNSLTSPDWLGNTAAALTAHGRVDVSTKQIDHLDSNTPRLYASDIALFNEQSPLTHIILSFNQAAPDTHAVVFAVSGIATGSPWPLRPTLSIARGADGKIVLVSNWPGRLQSCESLADLNVWRDEGPITTNQVVLLAPGLPACFYRVLVGNP